MRTTIDIDEAVHARLQRIVPRRGLNRFINEAVAEKVDAIERRQLEQAMKEGYLTTRAERAALNDDWAVLDTAGWPE